MSRLCTLLVAIVFLSLAILGIIPGDTFFHKLQKFFSANFFNQIFYFIMGIIALMCWLKGERAPIRFLLIGGLFLILLGLAGFITREGRLFHLFTVHFTDNLLHLIVGLCMLYLALIFYKK